MESAHDSTEQLPSPTRRNCYWFFLQILLRIIFTLLLKYRSRYSENLPKTTGGLVLVNHQSFLDPLLVGLPLSRPVSYLARDSLFKVPFLGWLLRKTYVYPISRDAASSSTIRAAVKRIQHGFLVGVFPEGTRTTDGLVGEIKPGFISLLRRSKQAAYPVGIAGAFEVFPRQSLFPRFGKIRVVYGKPISWEELEPLCKKGREQECLQLIRERILQCQQAAETWRNDSIA